MITLASDFGSPYPAAMKGAILKRCETRLVDVGHEFSRQNVRVAAFWLAQILPEFPPAVHLVVVDPGVGTDRAALVVRAGDHVLVGPDNGVLFPPARAIAGDGETGNRDDIVVYELDVDEPRSATFHGRDVFAPAAALVHETEIDRLDELDELSLAADAADLALPDPEFVEDGVRGEVLAVDDFGNVITNVPGTVLGNRSVVRVDDEPVPVVHSYAHAETGGRVVTVGSHGNVECAVNQGRGDEAFGLGVGDRVRLGFS